MTSFTSLFRSGPACAAGATARTAQPMSAVPMTLCISNSFQCRYGSGRDRLLLAQEQLAERGRQRELRQQSAEERKSTQVPEALQVRVGAIERHQHAGREDHGRE